MMAVDHRSTPTGEAPRPRWPGGLVGMLALVTAVEAGLARVGREIEPLSAADWGRARAAAAREAPRAEVLCVGDSMVKAGVVPAALEARLDRPAYNLAALGAQPPATYFLLRRALDSGARPRALVIGAKASQLSRHNYREAVGDWATLLGPAEALRLARDDLDPGFFGLYAAHLLPSVRLRREVGKAVLDRLAGREGVPWGPVVGRQYAANGGAVLFAPSHPKDGPDPRPGGRLDPGEASVCYPDRWEPHPTNLVYLDRALALAGSRGIPTFLVIPPIHPGVQAERERRGLDAAYEAIVREVRDRHPGVIVVDGRHAGFGHGVCFDGRHLDRDGATAFSQALAEVVAARLDGRGRPDRWEALPPFSAPSARLAIEDLDESRAIVTRARR